MGVKRPLGNPNQRSTNSALEASGPTQALGWHKEQASSDRGLSKVSEKASEKRRGTHELGFREHAKTVPQEGLGSGSAGGENGVSHGERQKWGGDMRSVDAL